MSKRSEVSHFLLFKTFFALSLLYFAYLAPRHFLSNTFNFVTEYEFRLL